jgi:chromosome segregation ATPase
LPQLSRIQPSADPWKWIALALLLLAAVAGYDSYRWQRTAGRAAQRVVVLDEANDALRRRLEGFAEQAQTLEEQRLAAERSTQEVRLRAQRNAEANAEVEKLLGDLKEQALSADEQLVQTEAQLRAALERAAHAETEAEIAQERVEQALNRIRSVEEQERQARAEAADERQRTSAARDDADDARRRLQSAERNLRLSLDAAERSLVEALKQYERAEVAMNQANRAAEMRVRSQGREGEFHQPDGLQDYRTLHLRAEEAMEMSRKRLLEAQRTLAKAKTGDAR